MVIDQETRPENGVMDLVHGILKDVHALTMQQLVLFRHEIKSEIGHAREAGSMVAFGSVIVVMGSLLLCGMLVHLLAQVAPSLPLWGCYGIVGTPIVLLGGIVCLVGIQRFKDLNTPGVQLAHSLKEKHDG